MKYYILYIIALWLLARAVSGMIDNAEHEAYKHIDEHERVAWSNGFERGVRSVSE